MTQKKALPVTIVLPDAGPLISLAKADALDLLLVFKDEVRVVITDFVEFEVTRSRTERSDAQKIADFIVKNAGYIEIEKTSIGEALINQYKTLQRYNDDPAFRRNLDELGLAPREIPPDSGELSIISFVNGLITNPPGKPVLILAEDDFFLAAGVAIPGNAHILSTASFLEVLERMHKIKNAKDVWADLQKVRPNINKVRVDRSAQKISTTWTDAVDEEKTEEIEAKLRKRFRP